MESKTVKKILRRLLKTVFGMVVAVLLLLLLLVFAIQLPPVQNYLTGHAVDFVEQKTQTEVKLEEINIGFPKSVLLKGLYVEDQQADTLLYLQKLEVDIGMLALLDNQLKLNYVGITGLTGNVYRSLPDSSFNFDFIIRAFSNPQTGQEKSDTSSTEFEFTLGDVQLKDIRATYSDEAAGISVAMRLGLLDINSDEINFLEKKIWVDDINIERLTATVIQTKMTGSTDDEPAEPFDFDLRLNDLNLSQINASYTNKVNNQTASINLGKLNATPETLDIAGEFIEVNRLNIENTSAFYEQGKLAAADTLNSDTVPQQPTASSNNWKLKLHKFLVAGTNLHYDDFNHAAQDSGIDYNHLAMSDLNIDMEDLSYEPEKMTATFNEFSVKEKSGLQIDRINGAVKLDSGKATARDFLLETPASHINFELVAAFGSLQNIGDELGEMFVQLDMEQTKLGFDDLLYFAPELSASPPFAGGEINSAELIANLKGQINDLNISQLKLRTANSTQLQVSGNIKNLPDINLAVFDIKIVKLASSRKDLEKLLPDTTLPPDINLPPHLSLTGNYKGSLKYFQSNFNLNSSYGNLQVTADMQSPADSIARYTAKLQVNQFDVGRLLNQADTIGTVTMTADVKGKSLDWKTMEAELKAVIDSAYYQKYAYHNFELSATVDHQNLTAQGAMRDTNLVFDFNGNVDLAKDTLHYRLKLNLEGVDLQALNFTTDDIRAQGKLNLDLSGDKLNNLNGSAGLRKVLIIKNNKRYPVDSLLFVSITGEQKTDISIQSDFMDGYLKGNINLADIATAVEQHINHYYTLIAEEEIEKPVANQDFEFKLDMKNPAILTNVLVPEVREFVPGRISGSYDSELHQMQLDVFVPTIKYNDISLDSLRLAINSNQEAMDYSLSLARITNPTININNPSLSGKVSNDRVDVKLDIHENDGYQSLLISGQLNSLDSAYQFSLDKNGVVFDNQRWSVDPENYLQFGNEGILAHQVKLENQGRFISVNSKEKRRNAPLELKFNNFKLEDIAQAVEKDEELIAGTLDGKVIFKNLDTKMIFNADLKMDQLSYQQSDIGNISVQANNKTEDAIDLRARLRGMGNSVNINGSYNTATPREALNFKVDVEKLQLASVEAFTSGELEKMDGYASGNFTITGATGKPDVNGKLTFHESRVHVTQLGSTYRMQEETISLDNKGVHFQQFTLLDSAGQHATLSGDIFMKNFSDFRFGLNVNINDFNILNKPEKKGALFYGNVNLTSDIEVRGTLEKPVVNASAELVKGSNLTLVLPPEEPGVEKSGGIDEFRDYSRDLNPILSREETSDSVRATIQGIDLKASLTVNKETTLKIFLDEGAGNYVQVKGTANLIFGIDPSGKITLTGRYELTEGEYQLVYRTVVRRKFDLQEGSYIIWSGDPLQADVNLTAKHVVETDALGLVQDQLAGSSQAELNRFKQELPFWVLLNMTGELTEPQIDFDIKLPPGERGAMGGQVQARLNQLNQPESESELNKQVFSLLVLGRFMPKDPLNPESGGVESAARSSVSKLLNAQLNKLSDRYIKGINLDLSLDSYEDYSTGQAKGRTELNVGIQKAFLNERLNVRVGSNIDLEGPQQKQQTASDLIGDISVEYELTKDGTWRVRGFRESQYEGIIEGEVAETGVSFIFSKDYDTMKDLRRKKENEGKVKDKQEESEKK